MTRSLAFRIPSSGEEFSEWLRNNEKEWTQEAEGTSAHLKVLGFDIDVSAPFVFLTLRCDTDEAMGMNMVTIAAEACGQWIEARAKDCEAHFVTVAGNVDSDKKPSVRTKEKGRGYSACAETFLDAKTIEEVLKSNASDMAEVATAKLEAGSTIAGALGRNLHVANIVAALLIATGQDAAHTVEGSLADTTVTREGDGLRVHVDLPALLLGVRGGGISLPSQSDCLTLLLHPKASLKPQAQLAESFAAAVLAGEVSLLAAQASHTLASAHKKLARKRQ